MIAEIFLGLLVLSIVVFGIIIEYGDTLKMILGIRLTAKEARRIANKKYKKANDEVFEYRLSKIKSASQRGERRIVFYEMYHSHMHKLKELGYGVTESSDENGETHYIVKW